MSVKERKKNFYNCKFIKTFFSQKGFYNTTIPDIAKAMQMSVGNMYNYFTSKEELAKCAIKYSTNILALDLKEVNHLPLSSKEKIFEFTRRYFLKVKENPEIIEYFFYVYI